MKGLKTMKKASWPLLLAMAIGALVVPAREPVHAQTSVDIFDNSRLQDVQLFLHPKDLALLRQNWQLNTFYPATLQIGSTRIRDVAVRSRGLGSRNPYKLGLEVDFDRFVTGRTVFGLSGLVLDNIWQDPTMVREAMALAMFHAVQMPASRYAFTRMAINGESQGLYAIVEPIDEQFLGRVYQDPGGYLYEYKWLYEYRFGDLGANLNTYAELFEPRSHRLDPAEALYGPLRDLVQAVNRTPDDAWRGEMEPRLDLGQIIRYVAIEAFTTETDGILGNWGLNNHYWYRPSNSGRHQVIAWDRDQAFTHPDRSIFAGADQNEIFRRALAQPDLRELFLFAVEECVNKAVDGDWFLNELERIATLITPAVEQDAKKQYPTEDFFAGLETMRRFAAERPGLVRDEIARSR